MAHLLDAADPHETLCEIRFRTSLPVLTSRPKSMPQCRQCSLAARTGEARSTPTTPAVSSVASPLPSGEAVESQLTSPEEESDHTWWDSDGGSRPYSAKEMVWHAALYRKHIEGDWCPLPAGPTRPGRDRQRLRLRIEHKDHRHSPPRADHEVILRRRGGDWELHGIRWPSGLLPGVVVTVKWPRSTPLLTAHTTLLNTPELVDGVEFLHQYDPQVVTRENAPGSDQNLDVPDLSDSSWVLRTLRVLGYLSADGSVTLAEAALARNCERLGFATERLSRLPAVVEQLVRAGRIQRVRGGLDKEDRPRCPARAGDFPAELLRYRPEVQALDASVRQEVQNGRNGSPSAHRVSGFVRRLPPGSQASAEQVELHLEAIRAAEVVDQPLPEGYTYVRHHRRRGSV
jgi:hypothetical protein